MGAAQLGQRGGLAGARRPGDDRASARGDLIPVELDQQPGRADHFLDDRCVHQGQVGVVLAGLVVVGQVALTAWPACGALQRRRLGFLVYEPPPPFLGR